MMNVLVVGLAIGAITWLGSFVIDALRPVPSEPESLTWLPDDFEVKTARIDGLKVRYIQGGSGPNLVLLHTLRTQLDIYQDMLPALAETFTVTAMDYPGHGWSDIPDVTYEPDIFYTWVETFLEVTGIENATLAGTSIGGTIPLVLAGRGNPRIAKAIAINPYDYKITYASGLKGSSFWAKVVHTAVEIPFLGEMFMRLRMQWMERMILEGGVADNKAWTDPLFAEVSSVGNRPGQMRGFISLLRESQKWQTARTAYADIKVPVLLIYGDEDWAPPADRRETETRIPDVKVEVIDNAGHFLSLDKPGELVESIKAFALP